MGDGGAVRIYSIVHILQVKMEWLHAVLLIKGGKVACCADDLSRKMWSGCTLSCWAIFEKTIERSLLYCNLPKVEMENLHVLTYFVLKCSGCLLYCCSTVDKGEVVACYTVDILQAKVQWLHAQLLIYLALKIEWCMLYVLLI
jgi:hypothetical protein